MRIQLEFTVTSYYNAKMQLSWPTKAMFKYDIFRQTVQNTIEILLVCFDFCLY